MAQGAQPAEGEAFLCHGVIGARSGRITPLRTPVAERITSAEMRDAPRGPATACAASAATRVEPITRSMGSR